MACIEGFDTMVEGPERVPLDTLDNTTLRAMCDGGWVDHATYLGIARTRGLTVVETAPPRGPAPDAAFVVSGLGLEDLRSALAPHGGRVEAVKEAGEPYRLTLPALDTRMQHQRPRAIHQPMAR